MPLLKHLAFQLQQPAAHLFADACAFRVGGEITLDVGPANLAAVQGVPAVGAIAIRDLDPRESLTPKRLWPPRLRGCPTTIWLRGVNLIDTGQRLRAK